MNSMYLVFDIGSTNMRGASSEDGKTFAELKVMPTPQQYSEGITALVSLAHGLSAGQPIAKAVIAVAALMNEDNTELTRMPNSKDWVGKPLIKDFSAQVGITPIVRNDAELAGLGEAQFGAGQKYSSLIFITISTGVGGAWVKRDESGVKSINIEPGHSQVIDPSGPICPNCNQPGHLESYISGTGLAAKYGVPAQQISDPKIWEEVKRHTAQGIYQILRQYPAEAVVLGGAIVLNDRIPIDQLAAELAKLLNGSPAPMLLKAELGDHAGLYGALSLAQ